jgi:hypothetical protein
VFTALFEESEVVLVSVIVAFFSLKSRRVSVLIFWLSFHVEFCRCFIVALACYLPSVSLLRGRYLVGLLTEKHITLISNVFYDHWASTAVLNSKTYSCITRSHCGCCVDSPIHCFLANIWINHLTRTHLAFLTLPRVALLTNPNLDPSCTVPARGASLRSL